MDIDLAKQYKGFKKENLKKLRKEELQKIALLKNAKGNATALALRAQSVLWEGDYVR